MKLFDSLQKLMEKFIEPIAIRLSKNKSLQAMQAGMMLTMPIILGSSVIAIVGNLPIGPWQEFLMQVGLFRLVYEVMASTLSMLAIYMVVAIAYTYAKNEGENGIVVAILALSSFITLMPQYMMVNETNVPALLSSNLGSNGIFVSMIVAIVVAKLYCFLAKKNLRLKMPDTVPPMVSDSLGPIFIGMILFTGVAAVKYGFTLTSYNDIFVFISTMVAKPIMQFGATPWALIGVYTFANLMWFFGIHPAAVTSIYRPVTSMASIACVEAFTNGQEMPYAAFMVVMMCVFNSGTGNTIGLAIASVFAMSEKFKAIGKITLIPNIFNINEPVIYGVPVMLNPIFFIPMVLSSLLPGAVVIGIMAITGPIDFNPLINMPWVTPQIITGFLKGGFALGGIITVATVVDILLYLPFFKIADKKALEEEQATAKEQISHE